MDAFSRKIFSSVAILVSASLLAGCDPDLAGAINKQFPSVSIPQEEDQALDTAFTTVGPAAGSNLIASVTSDTIAKVIKLSAQKQGVALKQVEVDVKRQFIWITISTDSRLADLGGPDAKAAEEKYLGGADPQIEGQLTFGMSVKSNYQADQNAAAFTLQLLPVFKALEIKDVSLGSGFLERLGLGPKIDVTPVATTVAAAFNFFSDRISGFLSSLDLMTVHIPAIPFSTGKINQAFSLSDSTGDKIDLTISADALQPSARLKSILWLADAGRVTLLALFDTGAGISASTPVPAGDFDEKFAGLKVAVSQIQSQNFNILPNTDGDWVAISKPFIAYLVNSSFAAARAELWAEVGDGMKG
jgi:hypothetical protein